MDERDERKEPVDDLDQPVSPPGEAEPFTRPEEPETTAGTDPVAHTSELPPVGQQWIPLPSWQPPPFDPSRPPYDPSHSAYEPSHSAFGPAPGFPYPPDPLGQSPSEPPKRHKGRLVAAIAAAIVLIGAGTGLGVALTSSGTQKPAASVVVSGTVPPSGTALNTKEVADKVDPAVVDVNTVVELPGGNAQAAGTGMIISSNGYILTNNHVVEDAISIKVTIAGRPGRYTATFVGADPTSDVAVIKVNGLSGLPVVTFGNSSSLSVGDPVVAIGNALGLGGTPTVSTGIVSALGRAITASDSTGASEHLTGMIQTDAPIEPGNSGGPLVDAAGVVIGMDTAAASADGTGTSLGFAIPINRASSLATAIMHNEHVPGVVFGLPAFLGIDGQNVTLFGQGSGSGVNIVGVVPGTPAAQAGIQPGDVITKFDGKATPTVQTLTSLIHQLRPGDSATVTFQSQFGTQTVTVHLVPGPAA